MILSLSLIIVDWEKTKNGKRDKKSSCFILQVYAIFKQLNYFYINNNKYIVIVLNNLFKHLEIISILVYN